MNVSSFGMGLQDSDMGENSNLDNMTDRDTPVIQGFTLAAYDQPSNAGAAAVMLQERGSQDNDRQIQVKFYVLF